jgi:hypothetical protein
MVITTAGFQFGPDLKIERVIDFRRNVDVTNEWMRKAEGCLASQVFTPHTVGDDGFTMSIWRDDASMLAAGIVPVVIDRRSTGTKQRRLWTVVHLRGAGFYIHAGNGTGVIRHRCKASCV